MTWDFYWTYILLILLPFTLFAMMYTAGVAIAWMALNVIRFVKRRF